MADKYKNKYRIDSIRLQKWDYGWNAAYFVTINCKDRVWFFGNIKNGQMNRSEIGSIAEKCWQAIPEHFPFVKLGAHIIMPDHVHGIIIIDKKGNHTKTPNIASPPENFATLKGSKNKFGPQSKNLASIVRGFKVGVTKNARLINTDFAWQSRYHDSILFDNGAFKRATQYIIDNPSNWRG